MIHFTFFSELKLSVLMRTFIKMKKENIKNREHTRINCTISDELIEITERNGKLKTFANGDMKIFPSSRKMRA